MRQRITICVDVDLNDITGPALERELVERLQNFIGSGGWKQYVNNLDSCIDKIKDEEASDAQL